MNKSTLTLFRMAFAYIATVGIQSALAVEQPVTYTGAAVAIGQGEAYTVVQVGANGQPSAIGVQFSAALLDGLPQAAAGESPMFSYRLLMPTEGPRTVIDHVQLDWESLGHPPAQVYDVPHFDFHFYLISASEQDAVHFHSEHDSGLPQQQPPQPLLPPGYMVPPGTAVPKMGVHAIDPGSSEFQGQPFTATFIYGYYNQRQIFIEPMVSLAYLRTKPLYSAVVPRPVNYSVPGLYPTSYSVRYDPAHNRYAVMLEALR